MFQSSDASQTKKESPSNAFQANQLPNRPLSAILWKLFFGGLLVDVISAVGLFLVGALSVTLRLSSYKSFLLGLIPIILDGLIIAGTITLIGKIFFGRSGPLDNKRWERYIMGQIPGFLLAAALVFVVRFWVSDPQQDVFSNGSVFLIFIGAVTGGFGLGMFSVFTHKAKDIASVGQAEAVSNVSQSKPGSSIEQAVSLDERDAHEKNSFILHQSVSNHIHLCVIFCRKRIGIGNCFRCRRFKTLPNGCQTQRMADSPALLAGGRCSLRDLLGEKFCKRLQCYGGSGVTVGVSRRTEWRSPNQTAGRLPFVERN
jgi:hypothetical protein